MKTKLHVYIVLEFTKSDTTIRKVCINQAIADKVKVAYEHKEYMRKKDIAKGEGGSTHKSSSYGVLKFHVSGTNLAYYSKQPNGIVMFDLPGEIK